MKEQLVVTLENSRNYTMRVAELMPAEAYSSKLTDTTWSFGELMHHIAYGIQWWEANYLKEKQIPWEPPTMLPDKQQIIAYMDTAYRELHKTLAYAKPSEDFVRGFYTTLDHITHHRGQAVLHLRGQGITPPEYTY